jgi:tetratricopeptide (TPR) repeat protein
MYGSRKADVRTSALLFRRAREADPTYAIGYTNQAGIEIELGHPQIALALLPDAMAVFEGNHQTFTPLATIGIRTGLHAQDAELRGDYAQAEDQEKLGAAALGGGPRQYAALVFAAMDMARQHDGGARAWLAQQPQPPLSPLTQPARQRLQVLLQIEAALEHWPAVIAMEEPTEKAMLQLNRGIDIRVYSATQLRPWLALAKAKTGDIAGAQSLIATTPGDCYDCVRLRGTIAAEAKQWGRADWWFARAVHDAPSIPMAYADWGQALLARGKPDVAIEKFKLANQKGPHFADPLEMWGEALMAKNQSHLALAKFAEAEKYAPNWGRLHLKWGEAMGYAGRKDEARAQYQKASTLDLTAADKAELARVSANV